MTPKPRGKRIPHNAYLVPKPRKWWDVMAERKR